MKVKEEEYEVVEDAHGWHVVGPGWELLASGSGIEWYYSFRLLKRGRLFEANWTDKLNKDRAIEVAKGIYGVLEQTLQVK
jgi:hypothetical protein